MNRIILFLVIGGCFFQTPGLLAATDYRRVQFGFSSAVLLCYPKEAIGGGMPCGYVIGADYDQVLIEMETLAEVNGIQVSQGKWKETLFAQGAYFSYNICVTEQKELASGATHYEIGFTIVTHTGKTLLSLELGTDSLENLNPTKVEGADFSDEMTLRFPKLYFGPPKPF